MWGGCDWRIDEARNSEVWNCLEFDFNSPARASQPNGDLEVFLAEKVFPRVCGKQFLPTVPIRQRRINTHWRAPAGVDSPARLLHLHMTAYFALDVPGLFAELAVKHAAYIQHLRVAKAAGER